MHYLYCVAESDNGPCKVGITSNIGSRLSNFQTANYRKLDLAWSMAFPGPREAAQMERYLLSGPTRIRGEWVAESPFNLWEQIDGLYFLRSIGRAA